MHIYQQKGQTLVEALIALSTALVVISVITITIVSALNNAQKTTRHNRGTQYAREGMEVLRKIRGSDWGQFKSYVNGTIYCLDNDNILREKDAAVTQGCSSAVRGGSSNVLNIDGQYARQVVLQESVECLSATPSVSPSPGVSAAQNAIKATVTVSWADSICTSASNLYCQKVELVSCFTDFSVVSSP